MTKTIRKLRWRYALLSLVLIFSIVSYDLIFRAKPVVAAQHGRPISDISNAGTFAPTPLWQSLDEVTADDSTTAVAATNNGGNRASEVLLSPLTDPQSATGHIMRIRGRTTSGRTSSVQAFLYQGTTLIASSTNTSFTDTNFLTITYTLTSTEANSINNYQDLRIRATFTDGGGGPPGNFEYTWAELEVPDYPNFNQYSYRWRSDDGNETSGSSLAAENTDVTISPSTAIRLRYLINNTGGLQTYNFRLEYAIYLPFREDCSGTWTAVPNSATTEAFNMASTSNYTDQAASTNAASGPGVITDPTGSTFVAGKLVKSPSNSASSVALDQNQFTELEYAFTSNSNATDSSYCFRVTNAGTILDMYRKMPILTLSYAPDAPVISAPANSATNVSITPTFQLAARERNKDYLKYVIEVCPTNSWPCGAGALTYDQTSSQSGWLGQDTQSATAYKADSLSVAASTPAIFRPPTPPNVPVLARNTTYFIRAKAIDPGGTNTFGPYSSVSSFTTSSLEILIMGGTTIGGTAIGCTPGINCPSQVKIGN